MMLTLTLWNTTTLQTKIIIIIIIKSRIWEKCNFYGKLFSFNFIEENDINRYLKDCRINPPTENDKNLCDSISTLEECKTLKNINSLSYAVNHTVKGVKVSKHEVNCLGIYIWHDKIDCYNKNWMIDITTPNIFWIMVKKKTFYWKTYHHKYFDIPKLIYIATIL